MTDDATHELEDHIELLKKLDKKRIESAKLRDDGLGYIQDISEQDPRCRELVIEAKDLDKKIKELEEEFKNKKKEPPILIIHYKSTPNKWMIAISNGNDKFKRILIEKSNNHEHELFVELQKYPANKSKIIALAAKEIKRTLIEEFLNFEVNDNNLILLRTLYRKLKPEALSDEKKQRRKAIFKAFTDKCVDLSLKKDNCVNLLLKTISDHGLSVWYAANLLQTLIAIPGGAHLKATFYCYYWIISELYTADSAEWSIGGARADRGG